MKRREWLAAATGLAFAGCRKVIAVRDFKELPGDVLNPERGFYFQRAAENPGDLTTVRKDGISLLLLTLDLRNHRNRPLDDAKLERLDFALKAVRAAGLKVIFRAAYGFTDADYRVDPLDLGLVRKHIERMASMMTRHAPVVWSVQAGMLGPWGEWHGSNHGDPPSLEARRTVAEAWLEGLPAEIPVLVRRAMFVRDLSPTAVDRLGWHNDALLANPDDMGTYSEPGWDRARELEWSHGQNLKTPFGGETVPDSEATGAEQVMRELELLRIAYLNRGYHGGTLQRWQRDGIFGEIEKRLGHRWVLRQVGSAGVTLENTGFAPLYTARKVEVAWFDPAAMKPIGAVVTTEVDLKGKSGRLEVPFKLPTAPSGSVLAVRLPDPAASLRDDGRYALHLASEGVRFDEASGWNVLA
ncbi:DUF4874 domain-containing protein [Luteolibacter arcticus]|uniref:DUF4874 domain-containing protein n=1 Tax=Luteolibacter arcticus TaxID=1581411 RepID=A0ABT3GE52_9BACT|nr:DUF4832 domain-containing protein [Luteolibacter arcticus]MCW1921897.1 DUF4874 domain-containing protein [Luteolibacter arcticus]